MTLEPVPLFEPAPRFSAGATAILEDHPPPTSAGKGRLAVDSERRRKQDESLRSRAPMNDANAQNKSGLVFVDRRGRAVPHLRRRRNEDRFAQQCLDIGRLACVQANDLRNRSAYE